MTRARQPRVGNRPRGLAYVVGAVPSGIITSEEAAVETITADALSALSRICPPHDPASAVEVAGPQVEQPEGAAARS